MSEQLATFHTWLTAPLEEAVRSVLDRIRQADDVVHLAVMPDVHLAGDTCVGTAMATRHLIYPGAVGGDIGCGMLAIGFDQSVDLVADPARAGQILRDIGERIPGRRHHRAAVVTMPVDCRGSDLSHGWLIAAARDEGVLQFGTLGGGNHFIELQADEEDRLWLMIHSGSRAMGQAVRNHHVSRATIRSFGLVALDAASDAGRAYLHDADWARRYAAANRHAMAVRVSEVLQNHGCGPRVESDLISVDHNHVQTERHGDEVLFVHRKGAMPADDGVAGVIPGSMGTFSVHVTGRGNADSLRSSAHGAGRQLSRHSARERFGRSDLRSQMRNVWFDPRRRGMVEEAPLAYKNLATVLRAQSELVRITRRLRPLLVFKDG